MFPLLQFKLIASFPICGVLVTASFAVSHLEAVLPPGLLSQWSPSFG